MQYFSGAGAGHIIFTDKYYLLRALVTRHFAFALLDHILFAQLDHRVAGAHTQRDFDHVGLSDLLVDPGGVLSWVPEGQLFKPSETMFCLVRLSWYRPCLLLNRF